MQVSADDNPAIEPLVAVLKNVANPEDKFDMGGSTFMVTSATCCNPSYYSATDHWPDSWGEEHSIQHLLWLPHHPGLHGGGQLDQLHQACQDLLGPAGQVQDVEGRVQRGYRGQL